MIAVAGIGGAAVSTRLVIGDLPWEPSAAFEEVVVLDRFNGVPTLGVRGKPGTRT